MKPMTPMNVTLFLALFTLSAMSQAEMANDAAASDTQPPSVEAIEQDTQDLLESLKAYGADQRQEAVEATKTALDAADKRIDTLQTRLDDNWDSMSEAAREKAQASMKALRERRTQVAEWYGSMKSSSESAWDEIKEGFAQAYQALDEAWDDTVQAFDSEH
ncbi:hypothetical protein [Allochromatium palmeri]|uniref:Uncharacterized protein n=1 Tax=Allochromatium palmeri TaxID=231048 RepID=A0A6N8EC39_9GAMM|nr:hypothetical protein [Allochromatium palmeri]MTW21060.1 hypothetical protein [Allochromatium palmeri]